ncbi:hypothetical protein F4809DRAFT_299652 [Biscogniauxia mediterranea]|nr:hypothetical protein F4809DRAFT_299652 [Biscogniauxia mediterranea]
MSAAMSEPIPVPVVNSDDNTYVDVASTAPTTPDASWSSSPILRADIDHHIGSLNFDFDSLQTPSTLVSNNADRPILGWPYLARPVRTICCVGAGYVGGPTAAVMAFQNPNIRVTVVDRDERRIRRWNSKHLPIHEPGLGDIVRIARDGSREISFANIPGDRENDASDASSSSESEPINDRDGVKMMVSPSRQPNLIFSTEVTKCISEADIILIAVNTPTKSRGIGVGRATDMTAFEAVTSVVAQHARPGAIIVEKSTVPCRTAQLVRETMELHRPGVPFEVLSNPEFLAAGTAIQDLLQPDRILIGSSTSESSRHSAETLAAVYAAWVPRSRILTTNIWSSELSKLVANSMLAQRISSINSISAICEKTGAEIDEVAASIGRDPRIGDKFLKAGIGFGGSCFKKDILSLSYLAESLGLEEVGEYWRQVIKMNEYQRDRFSRRVITCLNNTLVAKKITLLGYAFKANTSDTRESPALEIIKTLLEENPKEIAIYDPCCNPVVTRDEIKMLLRGQAALQEDGGPVVVYSSAYEACAASNAILITTEFDEFRNRRPEAPKLPGNAFTSSKSLDPRPFERLEPTETDILSLHKFLLRAAPASAHRDGDPLQRYTEEPACAEDCPDCGLIKKGAAPVSGTPNEYRPKERLDWSKIAANMKAPKWLFDGKGIIDPKEMTKLGIRLESVGRQGR